MKNVGDYEWRQISMWEGSPKECVEKFVKSDCGERIFHFYLKRVSEIVSENHLRVETVKSLDGVPDDIAQWRGCGCKVKS